MTTRLEQPALYAAGSEISPNLWLNEVVADRKRRGIETLNLCFGEARLPLVPQLAEVLAKASTCTSYTPVAGTDSAREAVAGYFRRRRLPTDASQVVLAPGSKPLIFATIAALGGDVYLPAPCWNSYAPQVALSGHTAIRVPITDAYGGMPDPQLLAQRIDQDRRRGAQPVAVIVNSPDNPTGTTISSGVLGELCALAEEAKLMLISDEIYRDLYHADSRCRTRRFPSPAELLPDRTVVCTGLSKSLAIGGWRIGTVRFPADGFGPTLRDRVLAIASDVWSTLAAPMQAVAAYAFNEPPAITDRLRRSARMHGSVARACYEICRSRGAEIRRPTGGFYVYADFGAHRCAFARHGVVDSASLADVLLGEFNIAVLPGHYLGDDARRLAFKVATTGFIGESQEEQLAALAAPDAAQLPHVRRTLRRLDTALAVLTGNSSDWER